MEKHADIPKIPVDIITGFKHSGKTSLINFFLQGPFQNQKISVFTNEEGNTSYAESCQLHTVLGGCLCCTAQADLIASICKALSFESPDRIIIELSGKGDIQDILQIFPFLPKCCLGQLVYVLDIRKLNALATVMGNFFPRQIQNAPVILLCHWKDLSSTDRDSLYARIRNWNSKALLLYDYEDFCPSEIQAFCENQILLPSRKNVRRQAIRIRFPGH